MSGTKKAGPKMAGTTKVASRPLPEPRSEPVPERTYA